MRECRFSTLIFRILFILLEFNWLAVKHDGHNLVFEK